MAAKPRIYTIGHSNRSFAAFAALLEASGITLIVDVRTVPKSRANPQFGQARLRASLKRRHIQYCAIAALGGLRSKAKGQAKSPNSFWENKSFRNYADYAMTPAFRKGFKELERKAKTQTCAIMCAEAVWWRCHRRIITDYLLSDGYPVYHIMGAGSPKKAVRNPAARKKENVLIYKRKKAREP